MILILILIFHFILQDFVSIERWSHIDIAGVMDSQGEIPYLAKGMAGN